MTPAEGAITLVRGQQAVRSREEAVRELYLAHYGQLAGWCYRLLGDQEMAHDVATEALTRLLAKWSTVTEPRGWLYMTSSNLIRDHWRRLERDRRYLPKLVDRDQSHIPPDPTVRDLVQRLPERLRVPVLLHYYADLPVRDIARLLGKAEGSVKRALFDARAQLARALSGGTEDGS